MKKIAICFFGITRSLTHTIATIESNILSPARELGEVRVFAHFFHQVEINNPRSGEKGLLRQGEHTLLDPDWLDLEAPEHCLAIYDFNCLKSWGDSWNDDFRSLRNLVHQLHSLQKVTDAALKWQPDLVIFARPDLGYVDSLQPSMIQALRYNRIFLPNWQRWRGGYNDRFAITSSIKIAQAYGMRVRLMADYCRKFNAPLHAELLLRYALADYKNAVRFRSFRASRVRCDGRTTEEDFRDSRLIAIQRLIRKPSRLFSVWQS